MVNMISLQIYPILDPKERSRLALIICNINFAHLLERKGAEVDLAEMRQLLEGLGYTVEVEKDLSSQVVNGAGAFQDHLPDMPCLSSKKDASSSPQISSAGNNSPRKKLWKALLCHSTSTPRDSLMPSWNVWIRS